MHAHTNVYKHTHMCINTLTCTHKHICINTLTCTNICINTLTCSRFTAKLKLHSVAAVALGKPPLPPHPYYGLNCP